MLAEAVLDAVKPGETVRVAGPPGSGKTALAEEVAAAAQAHTGRTPVVVRPAAGAPDAGVLAVASVAAVLGVDHIAERSWPDLVRRTEEAIAAQVDDLLMVVDESSRWSSAGGVFARRAGQAHSVVFRADRRLAAVSFEQRGGEGALRITAAPAALAHGGPLHTTEFDEATAAVASLAGAGGLATPLHVRLAAALVAWGAALPTALSLPQLSQSLADVLVQRRHGRAVWGVWQRLALSRTRLSDDALETLGVEALSPLGAATVREVLLDGAGRVHEVLRSAVEERPTDPKLAGAQRASAHTALYEFHRAAYEQAAVDPELAIEHAAEAFWHAGALGDETRMDLVELFSVDQLNALGHRVGTLDGDHRAAVRVYRRAIQRAPSDANAEHHLAWHLDVQGQSADEVVARYRRAIELEPLVPRWHSRYIGVLSDLARSDEARRAWAEAESAFAGELDGSEAVDELYMPIAASLLANGELAFCLYVLEGVPAWARDGNHRFIASVLEGRLVAEEGRAVVPSPRSGRAWWAEPPASLPVRDALGRNRAHWYAGRVEEVSDDEITIFAARVGPEGPHHFGLMRFPAQEWRERFVSDEPPAGLRAGRFVEIGRYRGTDTAATAIVLLPQEPVDLPIDPLPAARWLPVSLDATP